jgi:hypothetical protein
LDDFIDSVRGMTGMCGANEFTTELNDAAAAIKARKDPTENFIVIFNNICQGTRQ